MANLSQYMQVALLNYINQGSTTYRPSAFAIALTTGSPTTLIASQGEPGTGSGYSRQTMSWAAAAGTPATATNAVAATFGPFSSVATFTGIIEYDSIATATLGTPLWLGTLATPRVVLSGDSIVIAGGALTSQIN